MSSIVENQSQLLREKRSFFTRSASFEKFKCSAKYPFRVVGVKLSKVSMVQLAESIIIKSRLLSQRLLLVLFIILYKTICATLSILVRTSANPLSVVAVCEKPNKKHNLGFYERLQEKVEKLQNHKKRLESLKSSNIDFSAQKISTDETISSRCPKIETTVTTGFLLADSKDFAKNFIPVNVESNDFSRTNVSNVKDSEFRAELKRLREYSTEKNIKQLGRLSRSSSEMHLGNLTNTNKSLVEVVCLYSMVYGSILLMIGQLCFLTHIMQSLPITFGFLFLIGSLGFIAYITFKVFLIERFPNLRVNYSTKRSQKKELRVSEKQTVVETVTDCSKCLTGSTSTTTTTTITLNRQSRSRLKRTIDLSGKTLSKIKLL